MYIYIFYIAVVLLLIYFVLFYYFFRYFSFGEMTRNSIPVCLHNKIIVTVRPIKIIFEEYCISIIVIKMCRFVCVARMRARERLELDRSWKIIDRMVFGMWLLFRERF